MSVSNVPARHARMLRILCQLQSGSGLNAEDLADQLGVCRRTVFRDLNMMRQAGVDFYFDEKLDCYRLIPQEGLVATPAIVRIRMFSPRPRRVTPERATEGLNCVR